MLCIAALFGQGMAQSNIEKKKRDYRALLWG